MSSRDLCEHDLLGVSTESGNGYLWELYQDYVPLFPTKHR